MTEPSVRLIAISRPLIQIDPEMEMTAEGLIAYCARVSSNNQNNPKYEQLLKYCAEHKHWSIFEMVDCVFEVRTSRAIAAQILRHRSFSFQEFSQRYAKVSTILHHRPRRQDTKNRQNTFDDLPEETLKWWEDAENEVYELAQQKYDEALAKGIGKESARFLLPLATESRLFCKGSLRSWIHYTEVRTDPGTQLEHRQIAKKIQSILLDHFPTVGEALNWKRDSQ